MATGGIQCCYYNIIDKTLKREPRIDIDKEVPMPLYVL